MTTYLLGILVTSSIFALLALSLDLLIGYAGLFTIVHGALFGMGAYASALAALKLGLGFWECAALAALAGALVSLLIAIPSIRISGHYLVLASFGVQEILHGLYLNLDSVTGGPGGLRNIPHARLLGAPVTGQLETLALNLALGLAVVLLARRVIASPFGLLLRAIREDELVPQALGKDIVALKIKVFVLAGAIAGLAGSLLAHHMTFVSPESFDVHVSILVLSMVLVGGMGTLWGPMLGALFLIALPELLRFLPFSSTELGPLRQIVYGIVLIAFCFLRPQGLWTTR